MTKKFPILQQFPIEKRTNIRYNRNNELNWGNMDGYFDYRRLWLYRQPHLH